MVLTFEFQSIFVNGVGDRWLVEDDGGVVDIEVAGLYLTWLVTHSEFK